MPDLSGLTPYRPATAAHQAGRGRGDNISDCPAFRFKHTRMLDIQQELFTYALQAFID